MATTILEIPPPSIRPPPGFSESKRHSAKIRPHKTLPPLPLQNTTSYVDDISVSLLRKDILINTTNMVLVAENLIHRAFSLNLSFSVKKTDLIHFFKPKSSAKPKDVSQIPPLQTALSSAMLTPFIVNPSKNIRLLGITLDTTLSFASHLAQAASAGRQALGSINFLRTTSLGISAKTAHYIAISAILPKMLYESQVWSTGSITSLTKILSTYNQIARWITGLPRSTRITNLPPLEAMLSHIPCNYGIRLLFLPHNHQAVIPTPDDFNAQKLSGTDHVLS
jgi:hypothetical protein